MTQQTVVGLKTKKEYFTGDPISCRRFINDNQKKATIKNRKSEKILMFGFEEALMII